jgi:predicted TIM-barrel fold metal-dependent hydrolase
MTRPDPMLLPDPEPRERTYPIISVDDHLHEPRHVFQDRMPAHLVERAPIRIELPDGSQRWAYEDKMLAESGLSNVAGRDPASWTRDPLHDDEVRKGSWDVSSRVADMDIDGVYAQICFPSGVFGFSGRAFAMSSDQELGLASMRAYNDWHLTELAGTHPGRIVPMQTIWFSDPEIAAKEIRSNAEKGFKAATLPDLPQHLGLPRIGAPYWYPILQALEETETTVCLHLGAAGWVLDPLPAREDTAAQLAAAGFV